MTVQDQATRPKKKLVEPASVDTRSGWVFKVGRYIARTHGEFLYGVKFTGFNDKSVILAQISEVKNKNGVLVPMAGDADLSVSSVALDPDDNEFVLVRGWVAWGHDIDFRITLFGIV
ncbi:hypothetical protein ACFT4A_31905 [Streptomyces sp. NPDC057099]|uniref:hypothetical protein n=1 Tax=Streptomyces sp. NPDC057099 TaxID=3346019 RepID=UPI0036435423